MSITFIRNQVLRLAPIGVVVLLTLIVSWQNYVPGTFLSGWDTLHPEFNLSLNFERTIFGAWQEHQGLGAAAAQAHAAELPRLMLLALLKPILPLSSLRYLIFFLCYSMGGVGIYLFLYGTVFQFEKKISSRLAASLGALVYVFNLGTLQHFYVPLEMFAVHFATIGFLLFTLERSLRLGRKKDFLYFFIAQALSAPSAHTATLFYVVNFLLGVYALTSFLVLTLHSKKGHHFCYLKRLLLTAVIIFAAHFYWMGPNLYYAVTHSQDVENAKISREFSSEAFWQNQAFGSISDILILKNFLFNWKDYSFSQNKFLPLFDEWQAFLSKDFGYPFLYLVAIFGGIGIPLSLMKKRRQAISLLIAGSICFFFLNNLNFPSTTLYQSLLDKSTFLKEVFRFPFTKFSIFFMTTLAFACSLTFVTLFEVLATIHHTIQRRVSMLILYVLLAVIIVYPSLPVFQGNLISSNMKVVYPEQYMELFNWFDQQPHEGRILKLPATSLYGWTYQDWSFATHQKQGYQGAGFIWFGLQQPIMDREFDRWMPTNEYAFDELYQAIKLKDQRLFDQFLQKYNIQYILYDHSTFDSQRLTQQEYLDEYLNLIQADTSLSKVKTIGFLDVYKTRNVTHWLDSTPVMSTNTLADGLREDLFLDKSQHTISGVNQPQKQYPFSSLLQEKSSVPLIHDNGAEIQATVEKADYLVLPEWSAYNDYVPVSIYAQQDTKGIQIKIKSELPSLELGNQYVNLSDLSSVSQLVYSFPQTKSDSQSYILRLNNQEFPFEMGSDDTYVGSTLLSIAQNTTFSLFSGAPSSSQQLFDDQADYHPVECHTLRFSPYFFQMQKGKKVFQVENVFGCLPDLQTISFEDAGLAKITTSYTANRSMMIRQCLSSSSSNECDDNTQNFLFQVGLEPSVITRYEELGNNDEKHLTLSLLGEKVISQLSIHSASVDFYPIIATQVIDSHESKALTPSSYRVDISSLSDSTPVALSMDPRFSLKGIQNLTHFSRQFSNCADEGIVSKKTESTGITYSVFDKGITCDFYTFPNTFGTQDYLFQLSSENTFGKELQLFFSDSASKRTYLEEIQNGSANTSVYSILSDRQRDALSLTVQSNSYSSEQTMNILNDFAFSPFPSTWATHIYLENLQHATPIEAATVIHAVRHTNFWYEVNIRKNAEKSSVVSLDQSYDNGWIAFNANKPFQLLQHVTFDGWANAWIIGPNNDITTQPLTHLTTIYILYWPQVLEFAGFGLFLLVISILLWKWKK